MNKKIERNSEELKQTAMDELKLVQDIISRQEEFTFKVFSWAVGIVTTFTLGFFHKSIDINAYLYILIGLVITVIFFIVAKKHWGTFYNALSRSEQIETEMNDGYDGVKINQILKEGKAPKVISKEFSLIYYRFYLPYIALCLIVLLSGIGKIIIEN